MNTLATNQLFHGRYRLMEQKGTGSFGEVWLAHDEQLDIDVAVKVYVALDDRGIEEFREEFKTSWTLNHPNLLHANYYDVDERRPFLVMPYCPYKAESLVGTIDETEVWKFIRDVSSGLAYIHDKDIVHHDIKPDNILKTSDGTYVITDFGISQRMRSTLRRNSTRQIGSTTEVGGGSLPYMAPEMFSGMPDAVKATDIWALGVTLYEIVTGDLPFFGQGGGMQLHGAELPQINATISDQLKETIVACLQKDTWDRPTAQQLCDYSKSKLEGQTVNVPWMDLHKQKEKDTTAKHAKHVTPKRFSKKSKILPLSLHENKIAATLISVMTIVSIGLSLLFIVLAYKHWHNPFTILAITEVVVFGGSLTLLRNSKLGFWIILTAQVIGTILLCCFIHSADLCDKILIAFMVLTTIVGLPIIRLILGKKNDNNSLWIRMNHRLPIVTTIITLVYLAGAAVISLQGNIQAHKNLDEYNRHVYEFNDALQGRDLETWDISWMKDEIAEIKNFENKYSSINKNYLNHNDLEKDLQLKIQESAMHLTEYADSLSNTSKMNNLEYAKILSKALFFYNKSLSLYDNNDVREKYQNTYSRFVVIAGNYAYLVPTEISLSNNGNSNEKLYADRIHYLRITLSYYGLDPCNDHDVKLSFKIYNNGRLIRNSNALTYTGSYTYTIDSAPDVKWGQESSFNTPYTWSGYELWYEYGNGSVYIYEKGSLLVEIWCGNIKLTSKSTTLY